MKTIQVVLEEDLLKATDRAARKSRKNRSALVREALRAYLRQLSCREREEKDRIGYERAPAGDELAVWESEAVWPEE